MTPGRRLRILLVEDDAIFAAVTAEVMRERALVRWTPTAESAIAAAGEKDWDLIITDVELPGMSGLELVMKIKAAQPHVATLILTGHRSFDNAVEAIRVGADKDGTWIKAVGTHGSGENQSTRRTALPWTRRRDSFTSAIAATSASRSMTPI